MRAHSPKQKAGGLAGIVNSPPVAADVATDQSHIPEIKRGRLRKLGRLSLAGIEKFNYDRAMVTLQLAISCDRIFVRA